MVDDRPHHHALAKDKNVVVGVDLPLTGAVKLKSFSGLRADVTGVLPSIIM